MEWLGLYHDDVINWNSFRKRCWHFCAGNSPVSGEFPSQRPVTRSFDEFFDLRLNKQLSKQSKRRWFETQSRSLWRQCSVLLMPEQLGSGYIWSVWLGSSLVQIKSSDGLARFEKAVVQAARKRLYSKRVTSEWLCQPYVYMRAVSK